MASLAGCITADPPSHKEVQKEALSNVAVPSAWKAGATEGAIADNWLKTFDDADLNALVAEAIAHNPDLRVAAVRVETAAEYVELAKAPLRPWVGIRGTGGFKMGGGDISSALQGVSLFASWELDLWGRLRYARNASEATYASAQADFEFARQSLAATTAKSWFAASQTWLQLQIAQGMVKAAEEVVSVTERRLRVGASSDQDLALARASLDSYQDTVEQTRLAHSQALRALELLVGRYPAAEVSVRHDLGKLPGPVPAGLPLELLERRPDLIAAERRVAAAFNRVGEAKAARLPQITLNANIATIKSDILQLQPDFTNPTGGAGIRLFAPIYQGGSLQSQVRIRTLEQKEAVAQYAQLALRALGDVENALTASQTLAERARLLQAAVTDNQRALVLARDSFQTGKTDIRPVQQQQLTVYTAQMALVAVQSEQLAQRANLHLALGGKFETAAEQAQATTTNE